MSQAANTFSLNRSGSISRVHSMARQGIAAHRLIDGLVVIVMVAASAICASVYWRTSAELSVATARHEAMHGRLEQLKIETGRLERDIERLRTDKGFIETIARHDLGFVRPGEIVIRLRPDANNVATGERTVRVARLRALRESILTSPSPDSYTATSN